MTVVQFPPKTLTPSDTSADKKLDRSGHLPYLGLMSARYIADISICKEKNDTRGTRKEPKLGNGHLPPVMQDGINGQSPKLGKSRDPRCNTETHPTKDVLNRG